MIQLCITFRPTLVPPKIKLSHFNEMTRGQGWGLVSISTLVNKAEVFVNVPVNHIREEGLFGHHNCISDL